MTTLYVSPTFHAALTPMTELVSTGCTMCSIDTSFSSTVLQLGPRVVEVEARLGKYSNSGFTSGVTPAMFDSVITKLSSFKGWVFASAEWEPVHDYFYTVEGHTIRTRKVFSDVDGSVEHVIKKRLKNVDISCAVSRPMPHMFNTVDIRGSLSLEQHVQLPEGFCVQPERVVHKSQKRFQYKNWLFVVSKIDGRDAPEFHVEVEVLQLESVIGDLSKQQYVALGLLMKLTDFYPPVDSPFMLLPIK